jgi:hypothetical protein
VAGVVFATTAVAANPAVLSPAPAANPWPCCASQCCCSSGVTPAAAAVAAAIVLAQTAVGCCSRAVVALARAFWGYAAL